MVSWQRKFAPKTALVTLEVLQEFEVAGWPRAIESPLSEFGPQKTQNILRTLNNQAEIRFQSNGNYIERFFAAVSET